LAPTCHLSTLNLHWAGSLKDYLYLSRGSKLFFLKKYGSVHAMSSSDLQ
jgi:hypothetical protein